MSIKSRINFAKSIILSHKNIYFGGFAALLAALILALILGSGVLAIVACCIWVVYEAIVDLYFLGFIRKPSIEIEDVTFKGSIDYQKLNQQGISEANDNSDNLNVNSDSGININVSITDEHQS